jgi:hypothetical protein
MLAREDDWNYETFTPYLLPVNENYNKLIDKGKVIQELYYIQTPVVLRFNLVNGNTTLLINAGLGLNFLAGNSVIFKQGGETTNLGKTIGNKKYKYKRHSGEQGLREISEITSALL